MAAMTVPRVRQGRVDDAILAASEILCRRYPVASMLFDAFYPDLVRLVRQRFARVQISELDRIGRIAEGLDRLAAPESRLRAEVVAIDQGQPIRAARKTKRPRTKGQTKGARTRPKPEAKPEARQVIIRRVERPSPEIASEILDAEIVEE
jgi:hypothetical protein